MYKRKITPQNVLSGMPGCWTDILWGMGWPLDEINSLKFNGREHKKIQPILDQLVKDGKAAERHYPAEYTVYFRTDT